MSSMPEIKKLTDKRLIESKAFSPSRGFINSVSALLLFLVEGISFEAVSKPELASCDSDFT